MTRITRIIGMTCGALWALPLTAGCLGGGGDEGSVDCGVGDAVVYEGRDYCVYAAPLIIEGFHCPAALPFEFGVPGGERVCARDDAHPPGGPEAVVEAWEEAYDHHGGGDTIILTSAPDAGTSPVDDATSSPVGDATAAPSDVDAGRSDGGGAVEGPETWCERRQGDVAIGEDLIVIDWECPVTTRCGRYAVLAECHESLPGDVWYCTCDAFGNQRCGDLGADRAGTCPPVEAPLGDACAHPLVDAACASDGYCEGGAPGEFVPGEDNWGTCEALPGLCNGWSCYDDADCQAGGGTERCVGADRITGERGACRAPVEPGACLADADCPSQWRCEGAEIACEDPCTCTDVGAPDAPGECRRESGSSEPSLWLPGPVERRAGDRLEVYWVRPSVAEASVYLSCPSWELMRQDIAQGTWEVVESEPCEDVAVEELASGDIVHRGGAIASVPDGEGRAHYRVRGEYYRGCAPGDLPSDCESGPFGRLGGRSVIVR